MSASRERKKRVEQTAIEQPAKKKKKLSEGWIFTISVVLVLALVIGGLLIYRNRQAHATILTVGGHEIEGTEFSYYYCDLANYLGSYSTYFGVDTSKALDEQKVSSSGAMMASYLLGLDTSYLEGKTADESGNYDVTWAELLTDAAMRNAASTYAVYQEAVKAGYTLDEEALAEIEESVASHKSTALSYGYSDLDQYFESAYGRDCDEAGYRNYLKVRYTANNYISSFEYTDAELAARYDQAPEEFDTVAFYSYTVSASTIDSLLKAEATTEEETTEPETTEEETAEPETTEEETTEPETSEEETTEPETTDEETTEPETTEEETEEEPEESTEKLDKLAQDAANAMAEDFDVENSNVKIYADYTREYLTESMSMDEELVNWLFDEANEGDVKLFTIEPAADATDGETKYTVVELITRENYNAYDYITITVTDDAEDAELEEGELTSAEKVAQIEAALQEDGSEENFRKQVLFSIGHEEEEGSDHDHSAEGVTENASRSTLANASKELFRWLAVDGAEAGTWKKVELSGSTVFYFYLGEGENYRDLCVENTLTTEWYTELTEAAIAACDFNRKAALRIDRIGYFK